MKNKLKKLTIKNKIFYSFTIGFILLIILNGLISYNTDRNNSISQNQAMASVLSAQISRTLDLYFEDIERLSLALYTDPYIQDTLKNSENVTIESLGVRNGLYNRLFNQLYPRPDIERVVIHTNSARSFEFLKNGEFNVNFSVGEDSWQENLNNKKKNTTLILPTHEIEKDPDNKVNVVSLVRNIYNIPQKDKIGSIKIDINVEIFLDLLELNNVGNIEEYLNIIIIDKNNFMIYDQKNHITLNNLDVNLLSIIKNKSNKSSIFLNDKEYIVSGYLSENTNWDIIVMIDNQIILAEQKSAFWNTISISLIAIISISIVSYLLSRNITMPLTNIINQMKRVESGDLTDRITINEYPEINVLSRVYNRMLDSLNKMITEVYESSLAEKNAKISALQAQINPHFLYNTLNTMKAISRVKGVEEVAIIAESLSDLFKYNMRGLDKLILLEEEVLHIDNYIVIMNYRFVDRFKYSTNIEDKIKNLKIPKLIIQPLVENAISHGLENVDENGMIDLKVRIVNEYLIITVTDNGIGMNNQKLCSVKENIDNNLEGNNNGIALVNISQRLKLIYGHKHEMNIYSKLNKGTTVELKLPVIKMEER